MLLTSQDFRFLRMTFFTVVTKMCAVYLTALTIPIHYVSAYYIPMTASVFWSLTVDQLCAHIFFTIFSFSQFFLCQIKFMVFFFLLLLYFIFGYFYSSSLLETFEFVLAIKRERFFDVTHYIFIFLLFLLPYTYTYALSYNTHLLYPSLLPFFRLLLSWAHTNRINHSLINNMFSALSCI